MLKEQGYGTIELLTFHTDPVISFKCEGRTLVLVFCSSDPSYVRFIFPNIWVLDSENETIKASLIASEINYSRKCIKVYLSEGKDRIKEVWASIDFLIQSIDSIDETILNRYIGLLMHRTQDFAERMGAR